MIDLIPAIDIMGGQCVRLTKGDYDTQRVYGNSPADVARRFEAMGLTRLHVVDLDGARASHIVNRKTLEEIHAATALRIDFGGGIKQRSDLEAAFASGAEMVTLGSIAATQSDSVLEWVETYGAERFIVGADVLDGRVRIKGWLADGGLSLDEFVGLYYTHGVKQVLCTDISRDGMLEGPNVQLYSDLMQRYPDCYLIASGGVSCEQDFDALEAAGIPAVVFGKAYYEGRIDLSAYLARRAGTAVVNK